MNDLNWCIHKKMYGGRLTKVKDILFIDSFSRLFLLSLTILLFAGCVRYTAPRSELKKDSDKVADIGNSEEFTTYETRLKDRLSQLVKSRAAFDSNNSISPYVIGPTDQISVTVFGFPDLSAIVEVANDGTISLPMVGSIAAAGRGIGDIQSDIVAKLSRFVRSPRAQVTIKEYQANMVSVVGEVAKPGSYPLKQNGQQLIELISSAGGRTDKAGGRVVLIPANSSNQGGVEISYDDLIGNSDSGPFRIPILPRDTIIVPEAGSVEVYGEVEKPGSYKLASRTSVLGAVAAAGGFTYAAKVDEVEVIRDVGTGKKAAKVLNLEDIALKGFQDPRLRDGDVVRVPSESTNFFRRQVVDAINGTFRGFGVNR